MRDGEKIAPLLLEIPTPAVPAAVVHWYRETKDSPLHALSAKLWIGNDRVAKIEPVHGLGLTELQIKTLLLRILDGFSHHTGLKIERFRTSVELQSIPVACFPWFSGTIEEKAIANLCLRCYISHQ